MFISWLHGKGYTFHGDAPLSGLTRREELTLQLGFYLEKEQREKKQNSGRRKYTDPPESLDSAMASYKKRKIDAARGPGA